MNRLAKHIAVFLFMLYSATGSGAQAADSPRLQASTYEILSDAQADMEKFNYAVAKQKLTRLLQKDLKTYDKAVVLQTMGYCENGLGDFEAAATAFEQALMANILPEQVTHSLQYSAAQLFIHVEQPQKGLRYLKKWFANEKQPKPDAHIVAASAYYQLEDYEQLIFHVEKALSQNANPPLSWYQLLLAAYFETNKFSRAAELLEKIVVLQPDNKDYWLQLVGVYQELKQEKKALAIYELAYQKGLLTNREIEQLARSYLYHEMPFKAAKLMEKELAIGGINENKDNLVLLADSWLLAQENGKAESIFKEVVKKYNDDKTRLRLGQLYVETEQWQNAVDLLNIKQNIKDKKLKAKINLLLGIAQFNLNNVKGATSAFNRALSSKSTVDQARWWLDYLSKQPGTG